MSSSWVICTNSAPHDKFVDYLTQISTSCMKLHPTENICMTSFITSKICMMGYSHSGRLPSLGYEPINAKWRYYLTGDGIFSMGK